MIELFSIPIWKYLFEDFDQTKIKHVLENYKAKSKNSNASNHGGYQSEKNLQNEADLKNLFVFISKSAIEAANELNLKFNNIEIIEAWLNVNDTQYSFNHQHIHNGVLSGVFYVDVPEGSGNLVIVNPGMNPLWPGYTMIKSRNKLTSEAITIKPKDGLLILWPSYIPHSVETNSQDVKRISISFNIMLS